MRAIASLCFPLLRHGRGVLAAVLFLGSLARAGLPTDADLAARDGATWSRRVPEALRRPIDTDPSNLVEGPYTLDAGWSAVEFCFDFTRLTGRGAAAGSHAEAAGLGRSLWRAGLGSALELQVAQGGFAWTRETVIPGGPSATASGLEGSELRAKLNLWGNDAGRTAVAILAHGTLSRGAARLGGARQSGAALVAAHTLVSAETFRLSANGQLAADRAGGAGSGELGHSLLLEWTPPGRFGLAFEAGATRELAHDAAWTAAGSVTLGADLAGGLHADLGVAAAHEPVARTVGLFLKFSRSF